GGAVDGKQVFRPNVVARTSATAMETAGAIGDMLGRQLDRLAETPSVAPAAGSDCADPNSRYCESVLRAATYARTQSAKVLIVGQPVIPDPPDVPRALEQQASLAAAIHAKFGADPGVSYLDLSRAIDLADPHHSFDGMHLTPEGNLRLAQLIMPAVEKLSLLSER
ncbi:MAG: hypothetical protein ABI039_05100, partial [Vicinamibacterales bacterium]